MQAETWFERFSRQREERYRQERIERAGWRKMMEKEGKTDEPKDASEDTAV
jgi:hypothetical protein